MAMKLNVYLKQQGLGQTQAADLFGCTQGRISQLLSGATPSLGLAQRIADATGNKVRLSDWPAKHKAAA